jgi:peptidoglycan-associated lipoprotein
MERAAAEKAAREKAKQEAKATTAPRAVEALRRGERATTPASSPLKEVYFDFDRYDLRADARETLKQNADWLKANASARVEIEGHCDERGTNEYNLALGAKRAQAAKDYLVSLGIAANRLSTISYGEEVPVCRDKTEECWQRNRRARFVILPTRPAS